MWLFRREQEPEPEPKADGRTPITNMIEEMLAKGLSWDAVILAVRTSEQNAFRLLRTYQLKQQAEAVRDHPADKPARRTKADIPMSTMSTQADNSMSTPVDMVDKKRQRWRKQKENQRLKIVR